VPDKLHLSPDQLKVFRKTLPEPSGAFVRPLVLTGLRIGELLVLRWRDVVQA